MDIWKIIEQFAGQCPSTQRGRPINPESKSGKAAIEDGGVCEKKRKRDGETVFYRTVEYKNKRKSDKAKGLKKRLAARKVKLRQKEERKQEKQFRLNKYASEAGIPSKIKENISSGDVNTFDVLKKLQKTVANMKKKQEKKKKQSKKVPESAVLHNVTVMEESEKAIKINYNYKNMWIPKSQVKTKKTGQNGWGESIVSLEIPEWLAVKKGMLDEDYEEMKRGY